MELLQKISPVELVYGIETKDGSQYDVFIEIGYDSSTGRYWCASMFYYPSSLEVIRKSTMSTERLIELSEITGKIFNRYMHRHHDDVEYHFESLSRRDVC